MEDKTTKDVPLEMDPEEEAAIEMSIQETAGARNQQSCGRVPKEDVSPKMCAEASSERPRMYETLL